MLSIDAGWPTFSLSQSISLILIVRNLIRTNRRKIRINIRNIQERQSTLILCRIEETIHLGGISSIVCRKASVFGHYSEFSFILILQLAFYLIVEINPSTNQSIFILIGIHIFQFLPTSQVNDT